MFEIRNHWIPTGGHTPLKLNRLSVTCRLTSYSARKPPVFLGVWHQHFASRTVVQGTSSSKDGKGQGWQALHKLTKAGQGWDMVGATQELISPATQLRHIAVNLFCVAFTSQLRNLLLQNTMRSSTDSQELESQVSAAKKASAQAQGDC